VNLLLEGALLSLHHRLSERGLQLEQLIPDDVRRNELEELDPGLALTQVAAAFSLESRAEVFGATQAFVLGSRRSADPDVVEGLHALGGQLLRPYVDDPGVAEVNRVVEVMQNIRHGEVTEATLDPLRDVFGDTLVDVTSVDGQVQFEGPAGAFVGMLVELTLNLFDTHCRLLRGTVDLDGRKKDVTFVELDVCTGRPFARCAHAIDPENWQECNPLFFKVDVREKSYSGDGWYGKILEEVGPGLNGETYKTTLSVRCLSQTPQAVVAFTLAEGRYSDDDRRVSVDRGFLSVSDEGTHRRIRVLKVYRIEKFTLPHAWICPLWASQLALGGWWC
jgi:hypothetical protein